MRARTHTQTHTYKNTHTHTLSLSLASSHTRTHTHTHTHFSESVVDPKITRNVKLFQLIKMVLYIVFFAHLIGCVYYFLARVYNFDQVSMVFKKLYPITFENFSGY